MSLLPLTLPPDPPSPKDIRQAMWRHNLTRTDFARLAGVHPRAVQRWQADDESLSRRDAPRGLWHLLALLDAGADMTDLPADPPTADEIREWLDDHGMSQTGLAEIAGCGGRQARRWVSRTEPVQAPYWLWHVFRRVDLSPVDSLAPGG